MTDFMGVRTAAYDSEQELRDATFKFTQVLWLLTGVLEVLLAMRFLFKLAGVNAANPFASFLYNLTDYFAVPFASLIGLRAADGMVFEFSVLISMVIYLLTGWGLVRVVSMLFYRPQEPVSVKETSVFDYALKQTAPDVDQTMTDHEVNPISVDISQMTVAERTNV